MSENYLLQNFKKVLRFLNQQSFLWQNTALLCVEEIAIILDEKEVIYGFQKQRQKNLILHLILSGTYSQNTVNRVSD